MMNIKNKILGLTLTVIFLANPVFAQDANPIKWGISLGTGSTEYETIIIVDEDDGSQRLRTDEVDFSSMLIGFDARSGKHQVSFATNTADEESMSIAGSYYDRYQGPSRTADFDDQSFTYTYSMTDKWRFSLGYNTLKMDKGWSNSYDGSGVLVYGTTDTWTVTDIFSSSTERSGATAVISYVRPFGESGKWIAVGRLGFTAQDYEESGAGTVRISGVSAASESCWNGTTCQGVSYKTNGDGYDISQTWTGDSTSAIFGISLIYILDNPRHTLNFDFTTRDNDYGVLSGNLNQTAIGGYFSGDAGRSDSFDLDTADRQVDETIWAFSVKWRYGLN
jgi:hypothetical protein